MMMTEFSFLTLLLASNAVVLSIACVAIIRFERRWKRIGEYCGSHAGTTLENNVDKEVHEQVKATQRLEQRLGELQRTIKVMDMKAPNRRSPLERNLPVGLPIENAIRMARLGASVKDLTRNCGLNMGEARLMQKLHGKTVVAAIESHN